MSALEALQDDVAAVATVVGGQLISEVGRKKPVGVREARRRRHQDYAVRHKLRSPNYRSGSRCQFGIAGERKPPSVTGGFRGCARGLLCGSVVLSPVTGI